MGEVVVPEPLRHESAVHLTGSVPSLTPVSGGSQDRIAIFVPSLRGGGAEKAMLLFAEGLVARGLKVDLLVAQRQGPLVDQVPARVRVIDLAEPRVSRALPKLISYLKSERPVALYATIVNANIVALVAAGWVRRTSGFRCPVVVRESNVLAPKGAVSFARRVSGIIAPRLYRSAHAVISVSQDVATELCGADARLKQKVFVLPNPVISPRMVELSKAAPQHHWWTAGTKTSDADEIPLIVGAGRLHPQKDFSTLIQAFALLQAKQPARLLILGEGEERPMLEALVDRLGLKESVSLPGYIANPFPYLQRARTFVLSSRYEGMPNVLLQAMAFGTPVVATRCHSGAQEVLQTATFGSLVEPGNIEEMARAIEQRMHEPKSVESAHFVHERFSVERATTEYLLAAGIR